MKARNIGPIRSHYRANHKPQVLASAGKPKSPILRRALYTGLFVTAGLFGVDGWATVKPGYRGVAVTMGKVGEKEIGNGLTLKLPLLTRIRHMLVKFQTHQIKTSCFSADLQDIDLAMSVIWRVPDGSAVSIFQDYRGDPFTALIAPRLEDAAKKITVKYRDEDIVNQREKIKNEILAALKERVPELEVKDVVIDNLDLSEALEDSIERKMKEDQLAKQAQFDQQLTKVNATIKAIKSLGESGAIDIQGQAVNIAPDVLKLRIAQQWDGKLPDIVSGGRQVGETEILLPLGLGQKATDGAPIIVADVLKKLEEARDGYITKIKAERAKFTTIEIPDADPEEG